MIDRVTECRPLSAQASAVRLTPSYEFAEARAPEGGSEAMARGLVLATEQVASGSSDRSRLSNPQYDRSLNAMNAIRMRSSR